MNLLVGLLVVLTGCSAGAGSRAHTAAAVDRPVTVAEPGIPIPIAVADGTYALVWWNAPLHRQPRVDAPAVFAYPPSTERRPGHVHTFRVVAEIGEWLEVETVHGAGLCYPSAPSLTGVRARLYVRRDDLATTITTGMDLRFDDGSRVSFPAGVHAVRTGARSIDDRRAQLLLGGDGVAIAIELPVSDVGTTFRETFAATNRRTIHFDHRPTIGGLALVDQRLGLDERVGFCGTLMPAYETEPSHVLRWGPGSPRPRAEARLVGPYTRRMVEIKGCRACVVDRHIRTVADRQDGPSLFWEDGTPAGVSTRDVDVVDVRPSPAIAAHVCFAIDEDHPSGHAPPSLPIRLCADKAAVRRPARS